jgi:hypothetical protein
VAQQVPDADDRGDGDDGGLASVVRIDRREDIAGICGRVDGAPTFAVVVHAPDGNRQLSTELGMRRLKRHAEESGKVVAIATRAVSVASRARQVGIPVAARPEHVRWDAGGQRVLRLAGRSFALPAVGRWVQGLVLMVVAAGFAALLLTMAPSGHVVAYPPVATVSQVITITASADQGEIDLVNLKVPASRVSSEQHITLAMKTTGKALMGTQPAKVAVTISNPTTVAVELAAGAVMLAGTEFLPFELDSKVALPAGLSVSATATAARPGAAGNVAAGTVTGWLDASNRALKVTNPVAAAGGLDEPRPAVAAEDVIAIKALADQLNHSDAVRKGLAAARPHDAVFLGSATASVSYDQPDSPVGTPTDLLTLDVRVDVSALAILEQTLEAVARSVLGADQGMGEFINGSVRAAETGATKLDAEAKTVTTEIRVTGEFARNITRGALKDAVKGKSADSAKSTLAERYGIQDSEVTVSPGWAPWLPRFGFRIGVDLRSRDAEKQPGSTPNSNDKSPTPSAPATPGP